jgi:predicted metalloendopeptidase
LGENLADNGGMKMAYSAWKASQKNANATVPATLKVGAGKRLTKDQLFFVGFAQMWCSEMAPDYAVKLIHQDPHALPKVRILGSVSNSREFADAFKCPINAPMNPTKKCQLW